MKQLLGLAKHASFRIWGTAIIAAVLILASAPAHGRNRKLTEKLAEKLMDETLTRAPEDLEVCFSPEERCDLKLQKFIDSAKSSIDIAIFDLNLESIARQILAQSSRIPVRILADKRQSKGQRSLITKLKKAGADVRFGRQKGIMHNKFTLVDGKMVQTGSFNYTLHAARANHENQIYLSHPQVVRRYQEEFNRLWKNSRPFQY